MLTSDSEFFVLFYVRSGYLYEAQWPAEPRGGSSIFRIYIGCSIPHVVSRCLRETCDPHTSPFRQAINLYADLPYAEKASQKTGRKQVEFRAIPCGARLGRSAFSG